jgi:Ca2+-binding RTX toxin-like protein
VPPRALVCALLALAALATPAAAGAATITSAGGVLTYTGTDVINSVGLSYPTGTSTVVFTLGSFSPDQDPVTSMPPACSTTAANAITCSTAGITRIAVALTGGADTFFAGATAPVDFTTRPHYTVDTGTGNDKLGLLDPPFPGVYFCPACRWDGGDGNDRISLLDGSTVTGGPGADTIEKAEWLSYAGRTAAINATPGGVPDDGGPEDLDPATGNRDDIRFGVKGIIGGSGNDTMRGLPRYRGGPGADTIGIFEDPPAEVYYDDHTLGVTVTPDGVANDGSSEDESGGVRDNVRVRPSLIVGGTGPDVLNAHPLGTTLLGGPGDDKLLGAAGPDTLLSDPGADDLFGGGGSDTVRYDTRTTSLRVDQDNQADDGGAPDDNGTRRDNVTSAETLVGGSADDTLGGTQTGDLIRGLGGADTLYGHGGTDVIRGGDGNDNVFGLDGDDTLDGEAGADVIDGGNGTGDTADYSLRSTAVEVTIGAGADDGSPGEGDDVLATVERAAGGSGPDVLIGSGGDNRLLGGPGNDDLRGGDGTDTLCGGLGADRFDGGAGTQDAVSYSLCAGASGGVRVDIDGEADDGGTLSEDESDNVLSTVEVVDGTSFPDVLIGSSLANTLRGNSGDDVLDGLGGSDILDGQAGADRLTADDGEVDLLACSSGVDSVFADLADKVGDDCEVVATAPSAGFSPSSTSPTTGEAVQLRSTSYDEDGRIVSERWDLDGDGAFDDAEGPLAEVTFPSEGARTVRLEVVDDAGQRSTAAATLSVRRADAEGTAASPGTSTEVPPFGATAPPAPLAARLSAARRARRARVARRGLTLVVRCSAGCIADARLAAGSRRIGRARRELLRGGSIRFRVRLHRGARRRLARARSLLLTVSVTDASGAEQTFMRRIGLAA